jgi:6-pyruvoyltetrahydropterin/6-carboxytetrahydropterin synthase
MRYQVTKTITHEQGFSTAFRQWRADTHCRFIHGYALSIELVFEANTLDSRNWVIDFGSFKSLKQTLAAVFDHKTVIAADDPLLDDFKSIAAKDGLKLVVMPNVGCEAFAEFIADITDDWLKVEQPVFNGVKLISVEVREHGANAARYYP